MKTGKLAIRLWLSCRYTKNTLMDELWCGRYNIQNCDFVLVLLRKTWKNNPQMQGTFAKLQKFKVLLIGPEPAQISNLKFCFYFKLLIAWLIYYDFRSSTSSSSKVPGVPFCTSSSLWCCSVTFNLEIIHGLNSPICHAFTCCPTNIVPTL